MEYDLSNDFSCYKRFFENGILVDNGPLMLLFFGDYDKRYNTHYLEKEGYTRIEFEALVSFLEGCPRKSNAKIKLIITPHILTEFYKHARDDFNQKLNDFFNTIKDYLKVIEERGICKDFLIEHELFINLHIGEVSLLCLCEPRIHNKFHTILHHDKDIDLRLKKDKNILTINFVEHIYPWYLTKLGI